MTEENGSKKLEPTYHSFSENVEISGTEDKDYIVTSIGTGKKCLQKYELVCEVANVEECKDMRVEDFFKLTCFSARNMGGQDFVNAGFRKITTAPQFDQYVDKDAEPTTTADPTGGPDYIDFPLVEGGHAKMQELMDAYAIGRKAGVSKSQKAKAKVTDDLMKDLGVDNIDELRAIIAKKLNK